MVETPNFVNIFTQARAAGEEQGRQRLVQNAFRMYQTDPAGAENALMGAGAFTEANALAQVTQRKKSEATRQKVAGFMGQKDLAGARTAALEGGEYDLAKQVGEMDEQDRKLAIEKAERLAAVGAYLMDLPPEQRKQALAAAAPQLTLFGLSEEQVNGFDPTDENLRGFIGSVMSVKDVLEERRQDKKLKIEEEDKAADNKRAEAQLALQRELGQQRIAIARGQLGVSQGGLSLRRQAHQARLAAGGYGTPGVGGVIGAELGDDWEIED